MDFQAELGSHRSLNRVAAMSKEKSVENGFRGWAGGVKRNESSAACRAVPAATVAFTENLELSRSFALGRQGEERTERGGKLMRAGRALSGGVPAVGLDRGQDALGESECVAAFGAGDARALAGADAV